MISLPALAGGGRICPIVSDKVLDPSLLRCVRAGTPQFVVVGLVLSDSAGGCSGVWRCNFLTRHSDRLLLEAATDLPAASRRLGIPGERQIMRSGTAVAQISGYRPLAGRARHRSARDCYRESACSALSHR